MTENTASDAAAFFREIVEPTVAEFMKRPDDRRLACLACLTLSSMADHYFHDAAADVLKTKTLDEFRKAVSVNNFSIGQIFGIANATKHFERKPNRVGFDDIVARRIACGNAKAGWPINGNRVMVDAKPGQRWLVSHLVEAAMQFWSERVALLPRGHASRSSPPGVPSHRSC